MIGYLQHKFNFRIYEKTCEHKTTHKPTSVPAYILRIFFARAPAATLPMVSLADDLPPPYSSISVNINCGYFKIIMININENRHFMSIKHILQSTDWTLRLFKDTIATRRNICYLYRSQTILKVICCVCMRRPICNWHFTIVLQKSNMRLL